MDLQPTASDRSPDTSSYKKRGGGSRENKDSGSSSVVSLSDGEMIAVGCSLRESSECSLDSLNQDLPAHMQLVPFSSKSSSKKKDTKSDSVKGAPRHVKSMVKNVCTPQAVPLPRKAETNYDMDELVESYVEFYNLGQYFIVWEGFFYKNRLLG